MFENMADLAELCASATPEGLHLEYKLKQDSAKSTLSKDDRRALAEAIVSFANSDGGTLIYGIRSKNRDGLDVADALVPIADIDRFVGQMLSVAQLNVSPQIPGIICRAVQLPDRSGAGCAVCVIPPSDQRPHMSTAPNIHRYYRRSFEGSRVMSPSEIRDQMLAVREALLRPIVEVGGGGSFSDWRGWVAVESSFRVRLRNVGHRLCRSPFMRVGGSCPLKSYTNTYDSRLDVWKAEYPPDAIIHVDDESPILSLRFLARIWKEPFLESSDLNQASLLNSVKIFPGGDQHDPNSFEGDGLESITLSVTFGAENATARTEDFVLSRQDLARSIMIGSGDTIKNMVVGRGGTWREDLIAQLGQADGGSSSVWSVFIPIPNRIRNTRSSRGARAIKYASLQHPC